MPQYLTAFTANEKKNARVLLATQVVHMMGRKFEEGDWATVYCGAKGIPESGWSNLHIDIMHEGLGVEHKMLRIEPKRSLMELCGTSVMHPAATRSIRIPSTSINADEAMRSVFSQYKELIELRTAKVRANSGNGKADMRIGWLIWESSLTEFMYFEERMVIPNPDDYYAQWNEREARGARKESKNLWIYEKGTNKKRYSVTTVAGAKIQPYFDIPAPTAPELCYWKVQGEEKDGNIVIWVSAATERELKGVLDRDLDVKILSDAIVRASEHVQEEELETGTIDEVALELQVTKSAYAILVNTWEGVSDEHRVQLLVQTLRKL